jgi:formylglycine-generating enzyme required for sulfatase activity/predicted Ser/Thr protein kinase
MARIYISSTYEDLKKEREAAAKAVRRLGHQPVYMEDYVAGPQRPVEKCLQDVRSCDIYIGIFAWRYGFIPDGYDKSITHLEYEAANKAGIPCLIFLMDQEAPWPTKYVDTGEARQKINQLRSEFERDYIVSFFKNADELSGLASVAVSNLVSMDERSFIKFKRPEELTGIKLGKYMIREKLGRGGKGVVFKVLNTLEESTKAIKMVPPSISDSPLAFKDLKQELKIAARIIHPNVVKVQGLEEYDGHFFIVMEYIEGKNLEQLLAESKSRKINETEVMDIMQKIAHGLLEIHKRNVIHRDIKPANIMVTPGGQVKILDFGISYQVTKSMTELLGEHQWIGTWPYMAPEQLSTRYGRENIQVDIWGFGVTLYQLLSGELPFTNKDQIKDIDEKPYELEGVSGETRNIVMKCLEKDKKKRFKNMAEILAALQAISNSTKKPAKEKKIEPGDHESQLGPNTNKVEILPGRSEAFPEVRGAKWVYDNEKGFKEADYDDGIIMVYIPSGKFTMGSKDNSTEKPPHSVYLDGYWIGKYKVTAAQYKAFISETGHQALPSYVSKYSPKDNHPVIGGSWEDATAYCKWLSGKLGVRFNFKLPTEAQWEKAARGIDGREYPWGNNKPDETLANFASKVGKTAPVGSCPIGASPFGLLDMAGNVWEWCRDWFDENYYQSSPDKNPTGPKSGSSRVVRGGSWGSVAGYLRCANRFVAGPSYRGYVVGFRLCQDEK